MLEERNTLVLQCKEKGIDFGKCTLASMEEGLLNDFLKCGIGITTAQSDPSNYLTMVDSELRIRGFYNALVQEEADQLILELKILKK